MTTSYSTEEALRELAAKLRAEADSLDEAARILNVLRNSEHHEAEIRSAKERAASWMPANVRKAGAEAGR